MIFMHIERINLFYHHSWSLNNCPVSILAGGEFWCREVSVDKGQGSSIIGSSPLHPDKVFSQYCEASLPNLHYRLRIRAGIIAYTWAKKYNGKNKAQRVQTLHYSTIVTRGSCSAQGYTRFQEMDAAGIWIGVRVSEYPSVRADVARNVKGFPHLFP